MSSPPNEYHFLAPISSIAQAKRFAKMAEVLTARGYLVRFYGWERVNGEQDQRRTASESVSETAILRGGGHVNKRARAMYPLWSVVVFLRVVTLGWRKTIFCLGLETAFPAVVAAFITRSKIIFDDGDRLSMTARFPPAVRKLLARIERFVSSAVALHIIPTFQRYEWRHDRMELLENVPSRSDLDAAQVMAHEKGRDFKGLIVYINGWIGETRGAPIFLRVADIIGQRSWNVRVLAAGRVDSESGRKLLAHPIVDFAGNLGATEALALYFLSDLVLTYYDPAIPINRAAQSNKWGDCIRTGTPFVVNEEVEAAAGYVRDGVAWSLPYADADRLGQLIGDLANDATLIDAKRKRLRSMQHLADFETVTAEIFERRAILAPETVK